MALHMSGLVSRTGLTHPEKTRPTMSFERVLKFNPNHGKDGKFSSSGGGGGGKSKPDADGYDRSTATATKPEGVGPYEGIKNPNPKGASRFLLVPREPSHERIGEDKQWLFDLGKSLPYPTSSRMSVHSAYQKKVKVLEKVEAKALAKGVKSWDQAHLMANTAENENYHEVAKIFRARAKALRKGAK